MSDNIILSNYFLNLSKKLKHDTIDEKLKKNCIKFYVYMYLLKEYNYDEIVHFIFLGYIIYLSVPNNSFNNSSS